MGAEKIGLPVEAMPTTTAIQKIHKIFRHSTQTTGPIIAHSFLHGAQFPHVPSKKTMDIFDTDSSTLCQGTSETSHDILWEHLIPPDTIRCFEPKKVAGFIRILKIEG